MRKEIENRLINLSVSVIEMCRNLNNEYVSQHLTSQIIRSSTITALNYGEAQAAESSKDFIHKNSIVLKELRETHICLKFIKQSIILKNQCPIDGIIKECNELISMFYKLIKTAKSNLKK